MNETEQACFFIFKEKLCGYSGAEQSCNKSPERCKELNNYHSFPDCADREIYKRINETKVGGVEVYDPRDNSWKISDNPALVMADLVCRGIIKAEWRLDKAMDNPFWDKIEALANFCEGYKL